MAIDDTREERAREALTAKGLALSVVLDMGPIDLQAELAQAANDGSIAAKNLMNSTGMDDEVRAWQAGKGQEEAVSMVLPDEVEDPFRDAMAHGMEQLERTSLYEYPTGVPDLVVQATIGV